MKRLFRHIDLDYLRSGIFGFEDALVSTTGTVIGIASGTSNKDFIILAGLVVLSVEAISMSAGQYVSEEAVHQATPNAPHRDNLILSSGVMFVSYVAGGIIPIIPLAFTSGIYFIISSLTLALIGLYSLGFVKGKLVGASPTRSALEVLLIGGVATAIGSIVGFLLRL